MKAVPTTAPGTDFIAVAGFQHAVSELMRRIGGAGERIGEARETLRHMRAALVETPRADAELSTRMDRVEALLDALGARLTGDPARARLNEASEPSIRGRVALVIRGHWDTRQTPTQTQRSNIEIARSDFQQLEQELTDLIEQELAGVGADLVAAGAPWTPGGAR